MPASSADPSIAITVCVPATRADSVGATVRATLRQTWPAWQLLVVAQGPREPLERAVVAAAEGDRRVRFEHIPTRGLSRARNAAMEAARGSVLAFTDDDCEPREDWLASIAAAFGDDRLLGLVGGAVLAPATRPRLTTCPTISPAEALYDPAESPRRPPARWDWIGANFAIRRAVADHIGKFDECLGAGADFPAAEDTDYKLRLEAAGVRMLTTPRAAVVHTHGIRHGWRAILRSQRNYATGNGAMAGKLTLMGDPRGREWLAETDRACTRSLRRPDRALRDLRRLRYFRAAYERCLRDYVVDSGCLRRA